MPSIVERCARATARALAGALIGCAALGAGAGAAGAQTYGFATLQPGTLNHTTASAVAKVLKEKAGLNVLVQPTAGDQVIVPMVDRVEAEIGISNAMEVHDGLAKGFKELRIINHPKGHAAMLKRLLEVNTCPDFIEDKGHYYGHDLSDEDKRALIEYVKYF